MPVQYHRPVSEGQTYTFRDTRDDDLPTDIVTEVKDHKMETKEPAEV